MDIDSSKDRRSHIRIKDRVLLHCRFLQKDEYEKIIRSYEEGTDTPWSACSHPYFVQDIKSYIKKINDRDEALAKSLDIIDQKLSLILGLLQGDNEECPAKPTVVDLSAAGLAFPSIKPLDPDQILEIDLGLLPQHVFIKCYGKIMRCKPLKEKGYKIGVKFIWITEDDQDRLIEHIFRRQVIQLRMRRKHRTNIEKN